MALPAVIEPCLPSPGEQPPTGPGWLHEIKHDGYRLMAQRDGGGQPFRTVGSLSFCQGGSTFLVVMCSPGFAAEQELVGNWRLVAFQTILDNEPPKNALGADPKGYLILTPGGRMMTLITSSNRKAGADDAERAALHKTMFSYSGKYRVEGDMFITTVDVSWNEAWNGTEQKRQYRFEGDKLLVDTTRMPSVLYPGKMTVGRLVWERDK